MNDENDDNRSTIDKLFDIGETVLGGMEAALKPQENPIIDANVVDIRHQDWEATFVGWAVAHEGRCESWHAFTPQSPVAICGKEFSAAQVRTVPGPLPQNKTIFCCTSCIIALVSRG